MLPDVGALCLASVCLIMSPDRLPKQLCDGLLARLLLCDGQVQAVECPRGRCPELCGYVFEY